MNKTLFASSAIISLTLLCQTAFADSAKEISKEAITATQQEYLLEYTEQAQPRRSALFAHILDSLLQSSTVAKTDAPAAPSSSDDAFSEFVTI